jgi:hypothetical protein
MIDELVGAGAKSHGNYYKCKTALGRAKSVVTANRGCCAAVT